MNEDRYYQAAMFESKFIEGLPCCHAVDSLKYDELDEATTKLRTTIWSEIQRGILAEGFFDCKCGEPPYVTCSKKNADGDITWRATCSTCYEGVRAFSHENVKTLWNAMMMDALEKAEKED